jgi:tetratricopeptide (TPR) repeat protein
VSQLLDALRRVPGAPRKAEAAAGPRIAAVLGVLGFAAPRKRRIRSPGLVAAALVTLASIAAGALAWRPAAATANGPAGPADMFGRAVAFQQAGDFPRAIEIYNLLLTRDELPAESHNNLGLIHQQRGQLEDAAREFENALAHDPRYAPAHYNLGVLYDRSNDRGRAAGHYRAFLESRGTDYSARTPDVTTRIAALDAAR